MENNSQFDMNISTETQVSYLNCTTLFQIMTMLSLLLTNTFYTSIVWHYYKLNTKSLQGTIFGPLLFILFINDLSLVLDKSGVDMYTYDCPVTTVIMCAPITDHKFSENNDRYFSVWAETRWAATSNKTKLMFIINCKKSLIIRKLLDCTCHHEKGYALLVHYPLPDYRFFLLWQTMYVWVPSILTLYVCFVLTHYILIPFVLSHYVWVPFVLTYYVWSL